MKQYKLLKWYPSCSDFISEGEIVKLVKHDYTTIRDKHCKIFNKKEVENNPEYWEEVIEKDYEILSFSVLNSGKIITIIELALDVSFYLNDSRYNIHSVKRLSDGEVFTVGDKIAHYAEYVKGEFSTRNYTLEKIYFIKENRLAFYVGRGLNLSINNIQKVKKPLFTTDFEVTDWEDDKETFLQHGDGKKYFSTKEAAEEHINFRKPYLSNKDVLDEINKCTDIQQLIEIFTNKVAK